MKLFLLTTFVATLCYANAGKTERLLAAMMANGVNPGMLAAGLNPPFAVGGVGGVGGGAGLFGQAPYAQFVPGVPAFAVQAPYPNMYPVPAVNAYQVPYMGGPQMPPMAQMNGQMNPPQQPAGVMAGGAMPQQAAPQPGPVARFRRQLMKLENALKATMNTQIPTPTDTTATTLCEGKARQEVN